MRKIYERLYLIVFIILTINLVTASIASIIIGTVSQTNFALSFNLINSRSLISNLYIIFITSYIFTAIFEYIVFGNFKKHELYSEFVKSITIPYFLLCLLSTLFLYKSNSEIYKDSFTGIIVPYEITKYLTSGNQDTISWFDHTIIPFLCIGLLVYFYAVIIHHEDYPKILKPKCDFSRYIYKEFVHFKENDNLGKNSVLEITKPRIPSEYFLNSDETVNNEYHDLYLRGLTSLLKYKDYNSAARLFKDAIIRNHKFAYNNLGVLYIDGKGFTKDSLEGFGLLQKSAEQGNHIALLNIGTCYYKGTGTPRDYVEAYAYYNLASMYDNERAKDYLSILEEELSPSQIHLGQQRSVELNKKV